MNYYTSAAGLVILTKASSLELALDQIEQALAEEEIFEEVLIENIVRLDSRDGAVIIDPTDF